MNKKGQGLTLNTIIVAILVILVLVVLVAFFLGGSSGLTNSIKSIFFGTTAGTDETIALQTCTQRCEQIDTLVAGKNESKHNDIINDAAFCDRPFAIDKNGDGKADADDKGKTLDYYCNKESAGSYSLGVNCNYRCTN